MHIEYLTKKEKFPISNLSEDFHGMIFRFCFMQSYSVVTMLILFLGINRTSNCTTKSDIEHKVQRCKSGSLLYGGDSTTCFSVCSENKLRNSNCAPDPNPFLKFCGVLDSDADSLGESSGSLQQNPSVNFNSELVEEARQVNARRSLYCGKLITSLRDDVVLQSEIDFKYF